MFLEVAIIKSFSKFPLLFGDLYYFTADTLGLRSYWAVLGFGYGPFPWVFFF